MPRVSVLGVPIDILSFDEAVGRMRGLLDGDVQRRVFTPNNEMLVEASRDAAFRAALNTADLALPDSTGVAWACRRLGAPAARVPGVDAFTALCRGLDAHHPVFLLGAAEGVAERAGRALSAMNPRLRVAGTHAGSPRDEDAPSIIDRVNASGAVLLLVAYGAPAQETWIAKHLAAMPAVRVAAGVGGTLDFLAGERTRAPTWLRRIGLEWLWRLLIQPSRLPRIWRAVVVFPWMVLWKSGESRVDPTPPRLRRTGS
jgi:N-acetylglucosaminyldiphosphoundecaprenol N-acetyl-beta-D-mannosaminyltransferase